jgi:hypothetical protein
MRTVFAEVKWTAKDIKKLRPEWSLSKCTDWLYMNEEKIQERSIELTWGVIEDRLNKEDRR